MKKRKEVPKKSGEILQVHKELEGFEIGINSLGEIVTNFDIDTINAFLNKNVTDKKLKDRDLPENE